MSTLNFLSMVFLKYMEKGRRHQPLHSTTIKVIINRYLQHDYCGVSFSISWMYVNMKFAVCLELS
jgi:hypothetical protein